MAALIAARRARWIPRRWPAGRWECPGRGFTSGKDARPRPRAQRRDRLKAEVARLFALHEGKYGSPRITADLREEGWRVSETLSRADARAAPGGAAEEKAQGHHPAGEGPVAGAGPGQARLPAAKINRKWYGDGTEIPTDEGKLYLASVLDMASRRVLGFALGEHHDAQLAYGALTMAVAVRGGQVPGVIMHTDQGSEYTARLFRAACGRLGACQSMGRPGSALDNAVIESWHSTLELELRALEHFATKAQPGPGSPPGSTDYNRHRRHSSLQMMLPMDFEKGTASREGGLKMGRFSATQSWPVLGVVQVVPLGQRLRSGR